jgi:hypothetical protein
MASHIATIRDAMVICDLCGAPRARALWIRHIVLLLYFEKTCAGLIAFFSGSPRENLESSLRYLAARREFGAQLTLFGACGGSPKRESGVGHVDRHAFWLLTRRCEPPNGDFLVAALPCPVLRTPWAGRILPAVGRPGSSVAAVHAPLGLGESRPCRDSHHPSSVFH